MIYSTQEEEMAANSLLLTVSLLLCQPHRRGTFVVLASIPPSAFFPPVPRWWDYPLLLRQLPTAVKVAGWVQLSGRGWPRPSWKLTGPTTPRPVKLQNFGSVEICYEDVIECNWTKSLIWTACYPFSEESILRMLTICLKRCLLFIEVC